jgi:asparagine synthase (glutamine-hydrolysing)
MSTPDKRYTIIFNGEVYNYLEIREELINSGCQFITQSDTEVLLWAWIIWGDECLVKLKGMFAFAILDQQERTIACVRDAFGIKPFFYYYDEQQFVFSSEIAALVKILPKRPEINKQRSYDYLVFASYDNDQDTFLEGIRHLPPAHKMVFNIDTGALTTPERWWWPAIEQRSDLSFQQAAEELRSRFLDNIRLHMRSDVPLGAALSGGLDSSAIVCCMRHIEKQQPINTFSYIASDTDKDEEQWVDIVNNHINGTAHKVYASSKELAHDFTDLIRTQGEPFAGASIYAQYRVYQLAKQSGITVTLDGQGADELLAGYHGYPGAVIFSLLEQKRFTDCFRFIQQWSKWPGRSMLKAIIYFGDKVVPQSLRAFALKLVGRSPEPDWIDVDSLKASQVNCRQPMINVPPDAKGRRVMNALREALLIKDIPFLLRHGDRNSMRWSVESRVPFLTIDMAEFLFSLPEDYLISLQGETKSLFRAAMRGIVPDEILDRKDKIGFATPDKTWLKELEGEINTWIDPVINQLDFLKPEETRREIARIFDDSKPFSLTAWRLVNYCLWVRVLDEEPSAGKEPSANEKPLANEQ